MSDVMICRVCRSTTADGSYTHKCFDGPHDLVKAVVADCPHLRRDKRGSSRSQWRREAMDRCDAESHHPLLGQHVSVPEEPKILAAEPGLTQGGSDT